jgi:hypothetical protein
MNKKNPESIPIFYKDSSDLDAPVNELIESLRNDVAKIRGKLYDIKSMYGWEDRFIHIEGGLTCILVAMHEIKEEIKKYEIKHNV